MRLSESSKIIHNVAINLTNFKRKSPSKISVHFLKLNKLRFINKFPLIFTKICPLIVYFSRAKVSQVHTLLIRLRAEHLMKKMSSIIGATQLRHFIFIEN